MNSGFINYGPPMGGGFRDGNGMLQFGTIGGNFTDAFGTIQFNQPGSNGPWTSK